MIGPFIVAAGIAISMLAFLGGLTNMSMGIDENMFQRHLMVMGVSAVGGGTALLGIVVSIVEYLG